MVRLNHMITLANVPVTGAQLCNFVFGVRRNFVRLKKKIDI